MKNIIIQLLIDKSDIVDPSFQELGISESQYAELASEIIQLFGWVPRSAKEIPKDGREYLVKNENQGGTLSLIRYNRIHDYYENKGKWAPQGNLGTHWKLINH